MLRRPEHSKNEVVGPKEEEESAEILVPLKLNGSLIQPSRGG
jgi:hypothetical protein